MKASFHKYVCVTCDLQRGRGLRKYFLHVVQRADGIELFFATRFNGYGLDEFDTQRVVAEYRKGNFENAEELLDRCMAKC